jgi:hypothetical protein
MAISTPRMPPVSWLLDIESLGTRALSFAKNKLRACSSEQ